MTEDGPSVCEFCGGDLRRVFHPTGIIFKGSGFYKTDSRSSGSASVAGGKARSAKPATDGTSGGEKSSSSGESTTKPTPNDSRGSDKGGGSGSGGGGD